MTEYSVLIIDDDIWMQRILSKTLQSYGFKVIYLASNGFEGLNLAIEHKPDMIILDLLMPELSGQLTLKVLKNIKITKNIPVLIVSALSDTENLGLAVKSGTAGFVSKPFTRATIYEKLLLIFGKEKLDLIAKGESISGYPELHAQMQMKQSGVSLSYPTDPSIQRLKSGDEGTGSEKMPDTVSEEKRSIEAIKKMLQKSKK